MEQSQSLTADIPNYGLRTLIRVLLFIIFAVVPVLWWAQIRAKNETISDLKENNLYQNIRCDSIQRADNLKVTNSQNNESKWKDSFLNYVQAQNTRLERHLDLTQRPRRKPIQQNQ